MLKETKVILINNNNEELTTTTKKWEKWGWEKIEEKETTDPSSQQTSIKLIFTRDKDAPWYQEITTLGERMHQLQTLLKTKKWDYRSIDYLNSINPKLQLSYEKSLPLALPDEPKTFDFKKFIFLFILGILPGLIYYLFSNDLPKGKKARQLKDEYEEAVTTTVDYNNHIHKMLVKIVNSEINKIDERRDTILKQ